MAYNFNLYALFANKLIKFKTMKIEKRIKTGKLKGWSIRKSKHGWYALYSSNGVSQTQGKHTLDEIKEIVKFKQLPITAQGYVRCIITRTNF